ncbi:MAG: cytochrome d ubiquinol oxidase subunit II [Acidimicrobiales bacterium]
MSTADLVAGVMFAAVVLYAVLGGADFGSGAWDLLAGDARRGASTRRLIDHAIGPVWEANHVWLIFVLVFLWTGFPVPFATLMRTLAVPFWLVGLGIVLRGAGFAFRKYAPTLRWARAAGVTFALSSLMTPFFLGMITGAIASGRVGTGDDSSTAWLSPTSFLGGSLAVLTCTFLAGVFLSAEAQRIGDESLAESLRIKSLAVGAVTGIVALVGIIPLRSDAPTLSDGLVGRAAPLVLLSAIAGATTVWLLARRKLRLARGSSAVAVAAIVIGWGVAQYPWILVDQTTIEDGAGAAATMTGLLIASGLAAVLVVPPLIYLFILADTNRLGSGEGVD